MVPHAFSSLSCLKGILVIAFKILKKHLHKISKLLLNICKWPKRSKDSQKWWPSIVWYVFVQDFFMKFSMFWAQLAIFLFVNRGIWVGTGLPKINTCRVKKMYCTHSWENPFIMLHTQLTVVRLINIYSNMYNTCSIILMAQRHLCFVCTGVCIQMLV